MSIEEAKGFDLRKLIGKLSKPKSGFTPGKYKYMGPYNPLDKQLTYDPNTEEVIEWYVKPLNKVGEIAARNDIYYDRGFNKHECYKKWLMNLRTLPMVRCQSGVKLQDFSSIQNVN